MSETITYEIKWSVNNKWPTLTVPATAYHYYEITIEFERGCRNGEPWYREINVSGNFLGLKREGAPDSIGFSAIIIGATSSYFENHTTLTEIEQCPQGSAGKIMTATYDFEVIGRLSIGFNPGIGPFSFDFGASIGRNKVFATGKKVITVDCCEQTEEGESEITESPDEEIEPN